MESPKRSQRSDSVPSDRDRRKRAHSRSDSPKRKPARKPSVSHSEEPPRKVDRKRSESDYSREKRRRRRNSDDRHHNRRKSPSVSRSPENRRDNRRCLYVSNISTRVKEHNLEEKFGEIGELERVMIVKHPYTKESRGFAFINYKDPEKIKEAIEKFNNLDMQGSAIKVEFAKRSEPRRKTPGNYFGKDRDSRPSHGSRHSRPDDRDYDRPRR